jgi:hypothetical protein
MTVARSVKERPQRHGHRWVRPTCASERMCPSGDAVHRPQTLLHDRRRDQPRNDFACPASRYGRFTLGREEAFVVDGRHRLMDRGSCDAGRAGAGFEVLNDRRLQGGECARSPRFCPIMGLSSASSWTAHALGGARSLVYSAPLVLLPAMIVAPFRGGEHCRASSARPIERSAPNMPDNPTGSVRRSTPDVTARCATI